MSARPKVAVIGGGFGGLGFAWQLMDVGLKGMSGVLAR